MAGLASLAPLAVVGMENHVVIPVQSTVRHPVGGGCCPARGGARRTEEASGRAGHEGVYLRLTPRVQDYVSIWDREDSRWEWVDLPARGEPLEWSDNLVRDSRGVGRLM